MSPRGGETQSPKLNVALVVAAARNRVIGREGAMPWRVPSDLKTFRRLTMGHPIIMGRKTFQSIGRALDGRTNIVITRNATFHADGVQTAASLDGALALARAAAGADNQAMIIGGGEIYRAALQFADVVYMTEIAGEIHGDTWFPELASDQWSEVARDPIAPDKRDEYGATLVTFRRIAPAPNVPGSSDMP